MRGGRNYINADVEYRGKVTETGTRMTREMVYDETAEECEARLQAWQAANPGKERWYMPHGTGYRKCHWEDRGLEPYESIAVRGPYATIAPARRAAGTRRGNSAAVETGTRRDGGTFTRVRVVQVGTVEWKDAE